MKHLNVFESKLNILGWIVSHHPLHFSLGWENPVSVATVFLYPLGL